MPSTFPQFTIRSLLIITAAIGAYVALWTYIPLMAVGVTVAVVAFIAIWLILLLLSRRLSALAAVLVIVAWLTFCFIALSFAMRG